jgi:hypothetical protein
MAVAAIFGYIDRHRFNHLKGFGQQTGIIVFKEPRPQPFIKEFQAGERFITAFALRRLSPRLPKYLKLAA